MSTLTDRIITQVCKSLDGHVGLEALFLAGSHGTGRADAFSDIDFLAITLPDHRKEIAARWSGAVASVEPLVYTRAVFPGGGLTNIITQSWIRADLHAAGAEILRRHGQNSLRALLDPDDLWQTLPQEAATGDRAQDLSDTIEEFLRVLGLMHVALGRGECLVAQSGIEHLRHQLIRLMRLENGPLRPVGVLSLRGLLTEDQQTTILALPLTTPTADRVVEVNFAYARLFLPRARSLAEQLGVTWPEAFEQATRARLERTLGVSVSDVFEASTESGPAASAS